MKIILDFVTNSSEADYYDCTDCADCADCNCDCDCYDCVDCDCYDCADCDCFFDCADCDCNDCVCVTDGDCNSYGYPLDYDEWGYDN